MAFTNYIRASWHVLCFYFSVVGRFGEIHEDLPSGKLLERVASTTSIKIPVKGSFAKEFNNAFESLQADMRSLLSSSAVPFETTCALSFLVRALWGCAIWMWGPAQALCLGLAQFLVAPMSFVVCIMRFGTNGPDCVLHYLINAAVAVGMHAVSPWWPTLWVLKINGHFLLGFLAVDFALNLFVYCWISESFGAQRLVKHILYGTFNTKTYFIVVIGALTGIDYDLTLLVVTGLLTKLVVDTGFKIWLLQQTRLPCFNILFYCEHRIGHCPFIYQHAHKMHHYLHDTTAFDAHIYGSGMNEEFFWIMAETIPCLLCPGTLFPYFLNLDTLWSSWTNKGGHSRTSEAGADCFGDYDPDNWHADHHTFHRGNFGATGGALIDYYFNTQAAKTRGPWNKKFVVEKDPNNEEHMVVSIAVRSADSDSIPESDKCK